MVLSSPCSLYLLGLSSLFSACPPVDAPAEHFIPKTSQEPPSSAVGDCLHSGCHSQDSPTGRLKHQQFPSYSSRGDRSEITVLLGLSSCGLSPWCVDGRLLPVSSLVLPLACLYPDPASCKDTIPVSPGPALLTSFACSYLLKEPVSKCGHILKYQELQPQRMNFRGTQLSL